MIVLVIVEDVSSTITRSLDFIVLVWPHVNKTVNKMKCICFI